MTATDYLRPPRVAKRAPVVALALRTDNDRDGNQRHAFAVLATSGRVVEVIEHGAQDGESVLGMRWPWFDHNAAHALGIETAYATTVYIAPAEYKRWMLSGDGDLPELKRLRALGTRCAKWCAVRAALTEIRRTTATHEMRERIAAREGRPNHYADSRAACIYHRHPADGGDAVSDHLRHAMAALVRAGMVERTDTPANPAQYRGNDPDAQRARERAPFFQRSVGQYVATPTTPDLY